MKVADIETLWNEFANIQINKNDCTEVAFYIWKAGTDRVLIWKWFNKNLPCGLQYSNMTLVQLEALWADFSNTPINDDDEIEDDFYCWEKGTYRFDVWHWMDERLPDGIGIWLEEETNINAD
jgi:hypothetical protein